MRHIISFLLLISLLGCGLNPSGATYERLLETASQNRAELIQSKIGYDLCADNGAYYYGHSDVVETYFGFLDGDLKTKITGEVEIECYDSYSYNYYGSFKTRLADEVDSKIQKLSNEFMCISLNEDDIDTYTENAYNNELNSRLVNENDMQASNEEDVPLSELCDEIYNDYVFAKLVEKQQSKCMKMGFSLETNEMSNCVLQLISSEQKATTTTVVVDGGSSGSSDAVAEELRKMNKRQSIEYYNKMMKTGYDMMTCYTWPNC